MSNGAPPAITFAVIGRDEAPTVAGVLADAQRAAGLHDRVWYVDSDSHDGSVELAASFDVEVVRAPCGKGRAMAAAVERCRTEYICFLDADISGCSVSIAATLRTAVLQTGADMVLGAHDDGRRLTLFRGLYWPLADALFPDFGRAADPHPLTGQRAIRASLLRLPLPPGYGVETYLNLSIAAQTQRIESVELGRLHNPLYGLTRVPQLGRDFTAEILDFAVRLGRLEAKQRSGWQQWADDVIAVIEQQPPLGAPDEAFFARLDHASSRPLPPARAAAAGPHGTRNMRAHADSGRARIHLGRSREG